MTTALTDCCQCGTIHYRVTAEPLFTYACHCGSCQKRTGSAFSMGMVVLTESLHGEGEPTARLTLPARVPQFETQPEDLSALLQPALDYRAGG